MKLRRFALDGWIEQKHTANPAIEFDLAPSTGPDEWDALLDTRVSYTSAAGSLALRTAIAALEGVEPDEVQVVTGAS